MDQPNFLGIKQFKPECADILIFSIPYEGTVSYGNGASRGAEAILKASGQVELYNIELNSVPCEKLQVCTLDPIDCKGNPKRAQDIISKLVYGTIKTCNTIPSFPIALGGEHSITFGFLRGLMEASLIPENVAILQIDAHADLRNEYNGTPYSHACVMRRIRDDLNLKTVHVGVRAIGDDEPEYIKNNSIPVFFAPFSENQIPKIIDELPENVYLTFDVDGLDPSIMPATGTPVPGGLLWNETLKLLRNLFSKRNVIGMDMVELAPIEGVHTPDFLAAELLYRCIGYKFCL